MRNDRVRDSRKHLTGRGPRALVLAFIASLIPPVFQGCDSTEALTAAAQLELSPESLEFGPVTFGEIRSLELRITNSAPTGSLRIESAEFAEGASPTFSIEAAPPAQLDPGETSILRVRYEPDDAEPDAATIVIRTNALNQPIRRISMTSARTFPRLRVLPERVELGSILSGGQAQRAVNLSSVGDAPLTLQRIALRTGGFFGEPCTSDAECRENRCASTDHGALCTQTCEAGCPSESACQTLEDQSEACVPLIAPALIGRGFSITGVDAQPLTLAPGDELPLAVIYSPGPDDRGSAQLIIESNDSDRPIRIVPLLGRPEDLPPTAVAERRPPLEDPVLPGTEVQLSGDASSDPEGTPLTFAWRFLRRPQGSRATFNDPSVSQTAFFVDLPGIYIATLEVVDASGQASSNDARVDISAVAGPSFEVELTWNRPGTDIDLHVVPPGGSIGSVLDCFYDNPTPDWAPAGPQGDPSFETGPSQESFSVIDPPDGAFTIATRVVAASPQGPTAATVRVSFSGVEVARYTALLATDVEAWDIATISWPEGRIAFLGTIR